MVAKRIRVNQDITAERVRLIDDEGQQIGILDLSVAQETAQKKGLDLVEVSPNTNPPVCRILDYGKFRFERTKGKNRSSSRPKKQNLQIKEVKFRPGTDEGDYQVKLRNLIRFLQDGDKAKITLRFRGREMTHQELGVKLLKRIETDLAEYGVVEQFPKLEGRQMVMVIAPKK